MYTKLLKHCYEHIWKTVFLTFVMGTLIGFSLIDQYSPSSSSLVQSENSVSRQASSADNFLNRTVRVMCMIVTMPINHIHKAHAVKRTWAQRCDAYFFLSSIEDRSLPAFAATDGEGRDRLWEKTKFGLNYAWKQYSDYDFFFKADDDTYTIMENLRYFLQDKDPEEPVIMGRRFRPFVRQSYLAGGSGYVLSRAGLKQVLTGLQSHIRCAGDVSGGPEDLRIGQCAEVTGVRVVDSLDEYGLERFHPMSAYDMLNVAVYGTPRWYTKYNYHSIRTGYQCCSVRTISFHYIKPGTMYLYEYLLYDLHHPHP